MKVLELFSGTESIGQVYRELGHEVYTVDWNKQFNPTLLRDIEELTIGEVINLCGGRPDVIWASPDCTTYSISAISRHRRKLDGTFIPISEYAKKCDRTNIHMIDLIEELNPKYWFIENPRGVMRKMNFTLGLPRYTVTYCQYGDTRMKPTDIWTNHPNPHFKPPCKNGSPCHVSAPRGSKTGTQALRKPSESSVIPRELCEYIVSITRI